MMPSHDLHGIWDGLPAFVVASGPSLTRDDCEKIKGHKTIAVNCSVRMLPDADILYACDHKWWAEYESEWRDFKGLKVTVNATAPSRFPELIRMRMDKKIALSETASCLATGGNSGHQAINLAFLLGANPIYLLGFDCKAKGDNNHWHPDHDRRTKNRLTNPNSHLYSQWASNIKNLNDALIKNGVELVNCSRETALNITRKSLDDCLWQIS